MVYDEEFEGPAEPKSVTGSIKKYLVPLILIAGWLYYRNRTPPIGWSSATAWFLILMGLYVISGLMWSDMKRRTPKLFYNPGEDTSWEQMEKVGNWLAIRTGGVLCSYLPPIGGKNVVFTPIDTAHTLGRNKYTLTRVEEKPFEALDPILRDYIISRNIKPPYRIGYVDESQYTSVLELDEKTGEFLPKMKEAPVSFLISALEERNKENRMLEKLLRDTNKLIEDLHESMGRIKETKLGLRVASLRQQVSRVLGGD